MASMPTTAHTPSQRPDGQSDAANDPEAGGDGRVVPADGLVQVDYEKYDGTLHWNLRMRRLGEDAHGVWLGLPADSEMRKGHSPAVPLTEAHVILFPRDAWWTAAFNAAPRSTEIYCDITTPPRWPTPDRVTMVDLDLDVLRKRDTALTLLVDEDEFAEHQVRYGYPPEVVAAAEESARRLMTAVADGAGPFGGAHERWLAMVE
jgi:protein associated with RNAse G/E